MSKKLFFFGVCFLLCIFMVVDIASAMSSPSYRLEWYTPLTGSGGSMSSANYKMDFTVGQSASINLMTSTNRACLGYWCGLIDWRVFLPLILKN
ncbi:MAG: hypothetical protein N3D16_06315 [Anaerolineales bacterium]|nr:hypothetical protein [Anaerolineales bacterium]